MRCDYDALYREARNALGPPSKVFAQSLAR